MKKLFVAGVVFVCLAAAAFIVMRPTQSVKPQTNNEIVATSQLPPKPQAIDNTLSAPVAGQYLDYKDGIIEETKGVKLLFFHAPWCRQCQDIEASIHEQGVPKGVAIIKVDYDSATTLKKKYHIIQQTTLVRIDDQGNEIKKFVAYDEPSINSVKRELL